MIVVPSLHPAALLRGGDDSGLLKFEQTVIDDLKKAKRLTLSKPQWDESIIHKRDAVGRLVNIMPTADEAVQFLTNALGTTCAVDVETTGETPLACRLICVGVGSTNGTIMCIPFLSKGGVPYWSAHDQQRVREALARLLADQGTAKLFHNAPFDTVVLWSHGMPVAGDLYDTMSAHHVTDGELPHALAYVSSRYLDSRYWKDDVKGDLGWLDLPDETLRIYNCLPGHTTVIMANGKPARIDQLVRSKSTALVRCLVGGKIVNRQVKGWYRSRVKNQEWWSIKLAHAVGNRALVSTPDHRVFTDRGWLEAQKVRRGDRVAIDEKRLHPMQRNALIGTLLGDTSLKVSPAFRARFFDAPGYSFVGAHVEQPLSELKACFLGVPLKARSVEVGFGKKTRREIYEFRSNNLHQLSDLAELLYDRDGTRRLRLEALEATGPIGLAWWFMDDGCRQNGQVDRRLNAGKRGGRMRSKDTVTIAACRYPQADVQAAVGWFRELFGPTWAGKDRVIRLGREATEKFVDLVGAYVPNEMRRKLPRDYEAPPFEPGLYRDWQQTHPCGQIVWSTVLESKSFRPSRKDKGDRFKWDTRWCIDVDEAANFFTSQGLVHNCRDVLTTLRVAEPLHAEVIKLGLWHLYREEIDCSMLMARATVRGIPVDYERRDSTAQEFDKKGQPTGYYVGLGPTLRLKMDQALWTLRAIAGTNEFDPGKALHLRWLLFQHLQLPILKMTPSGQAPATDKEAMVMLTIAATNETQKAAIKALADFRTAQKMLSTFVEGLPILGDGRLHGSWRLSAVTGRFTSSPNCLDGETEVLTRSGWVKLPDLARGVEVMQWTLPNFASETGTLNFVVPTEYVETTSDVITTISNQHLDLVTTPDHRTVLQRRDGKFEVVPASEVVEDRKVHHAGSYNGSGLSWASQAMLAIVAATQADGFKHDLQYGKLRFKFDKKRKCDRLRGALQTSGIQFSEVVRHEHGRIRTEFKVDRCEASALVHSLLTDQKVFGQWILDLSREQLDWFVEELWHWDGSFTRKNNYSSSDRTNAEWAQTALALSGRRARMRVYRSSKASAVTKDNYQVDSVGYHYSWTTNSKRETRACQPTRFYCVSVPSSFLLVRRGQNVAVTGNCQNWPKKLKAMFGNSQIRTPRGDLGTFTGVDLSQAELRGVAYFASDKRLLEMYRLGLNVHSVNAALIFKRKPQAGHKDMDQKTADYCRQLIPQLLAGQDFDLFPEMSDTQWGPTRTLTKNDTFGRIYGAEDETVYNVHKSKRDPDTNAVLFPNLRIADTEATGVIWRNLNKDIVKWWSRIQAQVRARGYAQCPVSGRIRWYRGGYKRTEILNWNIQTLIASVMNKRMLRIQAVYDQETGGEAQIIQQVHDALNSEVPRGYAARSMEVKRMILSEPFSLRVDPQTVYPQAELPPDKPTEGNWLNEV